MALYRFWKGKKYPVQLENGWYVLGDTVLGKARHRTGNAVRVRTEAEIPRGGACLGEGR